MNRTIVVEGDAAYNEFRGRMIISQKQKEDEEYIVLQEIVGETENDRCGRIVTMSSDGSTIVMGSGHKSSGRPWSVSIFRWRNNVGLYMLEDKFYGQNDGDLFGTSLAASSNGNMIVVGDVNTDYGGTGSGSIFIYTQGDDGHLTLHSRFDGKNNFDGFGQKVAISPSGTMIVASSEGTNYNDIEWSGSVHVFVCTNDGNWQEEARFDGGRKYEYLGKKGISIEASDTSLVIHAKGGAGVKTYNLSCSCTETTQRCSGLDQYPSLSCILPSE